VSTALYGGSSTQAAREQELGAGSKRVRPRFAEIGLSLSALSSGQSLGEGPKLCDRHAEIVANRSHHVACDVGLTTFHSAKIVSTVAEGVGEAYLRKLFSRPHFSQRASKNLIRCLGPPFRIRTDWPCHPAIVEEQG
jgi:hypothetical protein